MLIKSHVELAKHIEGKTILMLHSLGKDSSVALEWLVNFARPQKVYALFLQRFTVHPDEEKYYDYLVKNYPGVTFFKLPEANELNQIILGMFQEPDKRWIFNHLEYEKFSNDKMIKDIMKSLAADYRCSGMAGYEGMGRAQKFHNGGLLQGDTIFPLGLMKKKDIVGLIEKTGIKLNPTYRHYHSTFDEMTFYRMRSALRRNVEFKKRVYDFFPLMRLDEYRWTRLINVKSEN